MVTVVGFSSTGGPDVLEVRQNDHAAPGLGEVWVEQHAIGINYLDVSQRNGAVPVALPSGLGLEGAGVVAAVGPDVTQVKVGDRVAYATGPLGAYASGRLVPAGKLVPLPDSISFQDAAAVLFKGITAQYLLKSTYPVGPGTVMVLYGVAGGVGAIMAKWAKHLGAFVIGVVSRAQSVEKARALGCDDVLVFDAQTLAQEVARITDGRKADVVYDPIGRLSFAASLDCLRPRGLMVSFGASSGAPQAVEVGLLNAKGSLFLTRPSIAAHTSSVEEYQARANDVLAALQAGIIEPAVWKTYPLENAAQAHADLESGRASGTLLLTP
ncbi:MULTISPECIES: quinone oxidoreductase [unclassified Pseudomonas]|uniref:quinone oxidoreductase family protein n=1 Tax=unclassified Pseudomonas TaxID=196821 RepID=UPI0008766190|nr:MULTISPECIES: quinone oxidoreductase [unclassified Pseudomonas]SCZ20182.1 Alcohol dehydrogenase GroES-like domain-containing protein [Pseudomonas sp. NFACC44-2]SDA44878.1 Alcohol dehydrogenase GroES-like domain-containing protein [Pseudomonas sp. NFACC51]SDW49207.1 Alcohol dehydrogenase GroES-like domain-containing protein [Pseudomonas sp. NFACC08-1]SFH07252.1 Alcohol dehydrogenase GroES-like domain-containing protein [Pseudomonas sp. NFACC54]SFS41541.1 Alcohol dehydrogenase GroES-like doma